MAIPSIERAYRELARIWLTVTLYAMFLFAGAAVAAGPEHFRAHLTGAEEVPPAATQATGEATFALSKDGMSLHYRLVVANIDNVLMAHIHLAPPGENGPVVVWLYPHSPPAILIPGPFQGVLAAGVITAADLTGTLSGQTLEDLLSRLESGDAYVNVHTSAFPGGEIRGQIR